MNRTSLRQRAEAIIEELISLLDQLDSDPDAEVETDFDINPIGLQSSNRVPTKRVTMRRAA